MTIGQLSDGKQSEELNKVFDLAPLAVKDSNVDDAKRVSALRLLGSLISPTANDVKSVASLLSYQTNRRIQAAAVHRQKDIGGVVVGREDD